MFLSLLIKYGECLFKENIFDGVGKRYHGVDSIVLNGYHPVHYATRNVRIVLNTSVNTK